MRVFIVVGVLFVACYFFKEKLFEVLTVPLVVAMPESSSMIFTGLPEAFFTYLKVSFFGAIFFASPYILYQIWKFISPGLYKSEKKYVFPFVLFSTLFFLGGSSFAYYVVFPFGFKFFLAFGTDFIKPMLSIKAFPNRPGKFQNFENQEEIRHITDIHYCRIIYSPGCCNPGADGFAPHTSLRNQCLGGKTGRKKGI